jgi:hypothetical protein
LLFNTLSLSSSPSTVWATTDSTAVEVASGSALAPPPNPLAKPKVYKNVLAPSLKVIASLASSLIAKLSTTLNLRPRPA